MALSALLALAVVVVVLLAYVRLVGHDSARWHVNPVTARLPPTPNAHILRPGEGAPVFDIGQTDLARIVDEVVSAQPRTRLVEQSADGLHRTWVQRSLLIGYPDYVTIRVVPAGEGASLALFSRSRYGHSDMGVNRKRAEAWMEEIARAVSAD